MSSFSHEMMPGLLKFIILHTMVIYKELVSKKMQINRNVRQSFSVSKLLGLMYLSVNVFYIWIEDFFIAFRT